MADNNLRNNNHARVKIVGVGGAGQNIINRIMEEGIILGVEFIAANTDANALSLSKSPVKLKIGEKLTRGLGAGGDPEIGKKAAIESEKEIFALLEDTDIVFILAGMGGGTGTGATPEIARIAKQCGAIAISAITLPFTFEGARRVHAAHNGATALAKVSDSAIEIRNDSILIEVDKKSSLQDAFRFVDDSTSTIIRAITDSIVNPGLVNINYLDVLSMLKNSGIARVSLGKVEGIDRYKDAVDQAINRKMFDVNINRPYGIILNVIGGNSLSMRHVNEIAGIFRSLGNPSLKMLYGAMIDSKMGDALQISILATGLEGKPITFDNFPHGLAQNKVSAKPQSIIERPLKVFLCHSKNDKSLVREIYKKLKSRPDIDPWLDEEKLLPGEDWKLEIETSVKNTDVVLVCLSNTSIGKEGFVQREIAQALDIAMEKPEGTIFIIPLRLEDCAVPNRLSRFQWLDYFVDDANEKLLKSLKKRAQTLGIKFE